MELIAESDARFLAVLNASEESSLTQLRWDFQRWNHRAIDVTAILCTLVDEDLVILGSLSTSISYSKLESIELVKAWGSSDSHDIVLNLTELGRKRWERDDWGITAERAKHLMFWNSSVKARVQRGKQA